MRFGPLAGVALLATGRGRGIERFGGTVQSFLASLAPLVAFPLVGSAFLVLGGRVGAGLTTLAWALVTLLAPPVLSHLLAVRWGKEEQWLRYATAFNWCQWAVPVAGFVIVLLVQLAGGASMSEEDMAQFVVLALAAYFLWLHWMVARNGLALGRARAVAAVLLVNLGTGLLVIVPRVLSLVMR